MMAVYRRVLHSLLMCMGCGLALMVVANVYASDTPLVDALKQPNTVLMIRHAYAPGIGDPENFVVNDCATQRNLDHEGRDQARAMGEWLRRHGIDNVPVYSSQWCRCLDTARLMAIGEVTPLPALNSFFDRPRQREPNLVALREFLAERHPSDQLIVLVTHQVTISAMTGRFAESGHGVVAHLAKDGNLKVLGSLAFAD